MSAVERWQLRALCHLEEMLGYCVDRGDDHEHEREQEGEGHGCRGSVGERDESSSSSQSASDSGSDDSDGGNSVGFKTTRATGHEDQHENDEGYLDDPSNYWTARTAAEEQQQGEKKEGAGGGREYAAAAAALAARAAAATAAAAAALAASKRLRGGAGEAQAKAKAKAKQPQQQPPLPLPPPHPTLAMAARQRLVAAQLEAARLAECTFAPDTSASQRTWSPAAPFASPSTHLHYLELNRARAVEAAARREAEKDGWRDCTFAPRLISSSSNSMGRGGDAPQPAPVPGLDRFLATCRRAAELRAEAAERAALVAAGGVQRRRQQQWGGEPPPPARFTVVEPLALETERRAAVKMGGMSGGAR